MIREYNDNIYDLLNDIEQNVEQYNEETVSQDELHKWKAAFNNNNNNKTARKSNIYNFKISKFVAAVVIVLILGGALFTKPAVACINLLFYHIEELMGGNTDLSSYSYAIDKTISNYGINIAVGDVIVDDDCLYVSYSVCDENEYQDENESLTSGVDAMVYVNGILVYSGSRGSVKEIDDHNWVYMMEYEVNNKNMDADKEYLLEFYSYEEKETRKIGKVSFIASGNELSKATTDIPVNHEILLDNGLALNLKDYVANPVQQKITFEYLGEAVSSETYDVVLRGTDNLGRKMMFYIASSDGKEGKMVLFYDQNESMLDNSMDMSQVTSFAVTAYESLLPDSDGKIDSEEIQVGEEFVIDLN